mmetsp:Transcript_39849/g.126141  ORF Transcript_39849/g.126141 Transcript_39849/m.126141 type:complete len:244 (+) Transcript_39849:96-827(+)
MALNMELGLTGEARSWKETAKQVPFQAQQVFISWVFIFASITLLLGFISLQSLVAGGTSYFVKLGNWFGVVSCMAWFLGFAVLIHWLIRIGGTKGSVLGAVLKLIASVLFNLQPASGTAGTAGGAGIWWSNLVGILFFHAGNIVSCADMWAFPPSGADFKKGFFRHGNLPVIGMWTYQMATWCIVASNLLSCNWNGAPLPGNSWLPIGHGAVRAGQYVGASLLTLGSCVYCLWCDGFRTCATE